MCGPFVFSQVFVGLERFLLLFLRIEKIDKRQENLGLHFLSEKLLLDILSVGYLMSMHII